MASGTLYVFFHGLSVMREAGDQIEAVLPRVAGHVYRAGTWLAEASITPRSVLRLRGVSPGNAKLYDSDFIIKLPDCSLTTRRRAATLVLPRPGAIIGLLLAARPQGGFVVSRNDGPTGWPKVATVVILTYAYQEEGEVFLEDHYNWEPSSTGGATSLHIISTSEGPEGDEHERETQKVLTRVIRGYPGVTFARPIVPPDWRDTKSPNYLAMSAPMSAPGVAPAPATSALKADGEHIVTDQDQFAFAQAELESYRARLVRLGRLGRLKRARRPIEGLFFDPDSLGEEVSNCVVYSTPL